MCLVIGAKGDRLMKYIFRLAVIALWFLPVAANAAAATPKQEPRIVAIGDIHGDYEHYISILRRAELIDSRRNWIGRNATLVQLGDVVDRGPGSRKILDLLMRLESRSRRSGGRVHFVIGNHEAMNVTGDLRYVHEGEYEAFRTPSSKRARDQYFEVFKTRLKNNSVEGQDLIFDDAYREKWNETYPLGFVEHRKAWSPKGKYGRWVAKRDAVLKLGDVLFVHGGIGHRYANWSIDQINGAVEVALKTSTVDEQTILTDEEGPLWYRNLSMVDEDSERSHVETLLEHFGVNHIVVAHTPLAETVIPRFGDRVLVIDVGLGSYYGRADAYLEISGDTLTTVQRGTRLAIPSEGGEALLSYLASAMALEENPKRIKAYVRGLKASTTVP